MKLRENMVNFEIVLLLSFIIALSSNTANVQSSSSIELDEISVIGTKTERLLDKQYLRWADTTFIQTGSAFQRYTQPGFHGGVNLKYTM